MSDYDAFLASKAQLGGDHGFEPTVLPDVLFPFQAATVEWATRKGRAAILADCGLGKSLMQLVWADNVSRHTGRPVLILTPLAVADQFVREGEKFGIDVQRSHRGEIEAPLVVTNYERLHLFDADRFGGVVCDESSVLKGFDGARRAAITEFMRQLPYRLLGTATAAPNDYTELGTSSEALGGLGHMDMLSRFFINDQRTSKPITGRFHRTSADGGWRFKGHADQAFWRWVASWARALRRPSDLGFADDGFDLPPLTVRQHVVAARTLRPGALIALPAHGFREEREERRRTIVERCETAAALVADTGQPAVVWCHLNAEGDLLERLIPGAVQVSGAHSLEYKEAANEWFIGKRCICHDPLFGAKPATWKTNHSPINSAITDAIATADWPNQRLGERLIPKNERTICATTTPRTATSGSVTSSSESNATGSVESGMPRTQSSGNAKSTRPSSIGFKTQMPASIKSPGDTGLQSMSTSLSSPTDVRFVVDPAMKPGDSTSTTATPRDHSEECSAPLVILDSASFATILPYLTEPPCMCGHASGVRRLITKPVIFGHGLNWQHCNHVVTFPSHSYEQYYQAVRRCWRFGQARPVTVDVVASEGESDITRNLQRKADQADRMFGELVRFINGGNVIQREQAFNKDVQLPSWLAS